MTMKKEIQTQIQINATPDQVWKVLIDFEKYSFWNPFVRLIEGDVKDGNKIKVVIGPEGSKPMSFTPKVLAFRPKKEFRWLGHLLIPGIFDGEHSFELAENVDGTTSFIHGEKFSGILVRVMAKKLDTEIREGFISMNQALKDQVETMTIAR